MHSREQDHSHYLTLDEAETKKQRVSLDQRLDVNGTRKADHVQCWCCWPESTTRQKKHKSSTFRFGPPLTTQPHTPTLPLLIIHRGERGSGLGRETQNESERTAPCEISKGILHVPVESHGNQPVPFHPPVELVVPRLTRGSESHIEQLLHAGSSNRSSWRLHHPRTIAPRARITGGVPLSSFHRSTSFPPIPPRPPVLLLEVPAVVLTTTSPPLCEHPPPSRTPTLPPSPALPRRQGPRPCRCRDHPPHDLVEDGRVPASPPAQQEAAAPPHRERRMVTFNKAVVGMACS